MDSSIDKTAFQINVHLVEHQVFYTPIYLCKEDGYDLKFTIQKYEYSDKNLVKELFADTKSKDNEIDVFITGGPDVVSYVRENENTEKGKVFFWMPIVDRFPLALNVADRKKNGKKSSNHSIKDMLKNGPKKVLTPPEDTTLYYFLSKFYDREAFVKKYLKLGFTEEERRAIIGYLEEYTSLFKGKLTPQKDFDSIDEKLVTEPGTIGFGLSDDAGVKKIKKFNPAMEVIAFTCIYTRKDAWDHEKKRNFLQQFCKYVSLNINKIHTFNDYYHRSQSEPKEYRTDVYESVLNILFPEKDTSGKIDKGKIEVKKQKFIGNLKYLAQHRIFAVNLMNDLQLQGDKIQKAKMKAEDMKSVDLFYKFKLYYWMSEGFVVNAHKAFEQLHEEETAQMAFLKSISASAHAIKTTINTLMSAPLNSLKSDYSNDYRIDLLAEVKETLLLNAELVNLLSKLSISTYSTQSKEKALLDSKLFDTNKREIDLYNLIQNKIKIRALDKTQALKDICLTNKQAISIKSDFLSFNALNPSERFFEMIVLTVIENCSSHGYSVNNVIELTVKVSSNELSFSNKPKQAYNNEPLTGNLRIIDSILQLLDLGRVEIRLDTNNDIFYTTITAGSSSNNG